MQLKVASLALFVFSQGWFTVAALSQRTYTADSLMTAFDKGSKSSPKGEEITFTGVVAEARTSRLSFKSSSGDRVICEFVQAMLQGSPASLVGYPLSVIGKVRGRGLLGNVTLDQCRLAAPDSLSTEVAKAITEEPAPPEPSAEALEAPAVTITSATEPGAPAGGAVVTPRRLAFSTLKTTKPGEVTAFVEADESAQRKPEETRPSPAVPTESSPSDGYWRGVLHAILTIAIAVAGVFALVKLLRTIELRRTAVANPTTPEIRRAALEQLLTKRR
jgi:hypothetical protein